jgi:hypothetical protein
MAIVTGGINGPFKGKVGSVYGYTMMGKNIIKSARRKTAKNKRGSVAQNASRSKFTKMQEFLRPILPFIRVGFNMAAHAKQMSAHNAAKSYNMLNAFSAEGEIDYSKVLVSFGNLPSPLTAKVETDDTGLHFSWTNDVDSIGIRTNDQVMLLAYNPKLKSSKYMLSGARRTAEKESLAIWEGSKGQQFHTWIAFISDDRQQISMSMYLGEINFRL